MNEAEILNVAYTNLVKVVDKHLGTRAEHIQLQNDLDVLKKVVDEKIASITPTAK